MKKFTWLELLLSVLLVGVVSFGVTYFFVSEGGLDVVSIEEETENSEVDTKGYKYFFTKEPIKGAVNEFTSGDLMRENLETGVEEIFMKKDKVGLVDGMIVHQTEDSLYIMATPYAYACPVDAYKLDLNTKNISVFSDLIGFDFCGFYENQSTNKRFAYNLIANVEDGPDFGKSAEIRIFDFESEDIVKKVILDEGEFFGIGHGMMMHDEPCPQPKSSWLDNNELEISVYPECDGAKEYKKIITW